MKRTREQVFKNDPAARWLNRPQPAKPTRQQQRAHDGPPVDTHFLDTLARRSAAAAQDGAPAGCDAGDLSAAETAKRRLS
jgi:hypothetical protein